MYPSAIQIESGGAAGAAQGSSSLKRESFSDVASPSNDKNKMHDHHAATNPTRDENKSKHERAVNGSYNAVLHPGLLYFYSESIGFAVNGICAFVGALYNVGVFLGDKTGGSSNSRTTLVAVTFIVVGGAIQLLTSLRSFLANDHFGATAFGIFSSLWFLLGVELLENIDVEDIDDDVSWSLPAPFIFSIFLTNCFLFAISPFLPAYNMFILGAIATPVGLETIIRFLQTETTASNTLSNLKVAQGISQFLLSIVAAYGCIAAILHGIHERQVLRGFEDAVVETMLWKRKANIYKYTDGKWANPKPLSSFSFGLGLVGTCYSIGIDGNLYRSWSFTYWFSTFSILQWITVFLFALRKETIHMNSALINSMIMAIFAYGSAANRSSMQFTCVIGGNALLCLAVLRIAYFAYTFILMRMGSAADVSSVDLFSYGSIALSFFVTGILVSVSAGSSVALHVSQAFILFTTLVEMYCATAELLNSISQKQILPLTFQFASAQQSKNEESESDIETVRSEDIESNDEQVKFIPPGDENLFGQSDFESAIAALFTGLAFYALMKVTCFLTALFDVERSFRISQFASVANAVAQTVVVIISGLRGQTSLVFCSFSFWLDCIALFSSPASSLHQHDGNGLLLSIAILQVVWLVVVRKWMFKPLVIAMLLHVVGLTTCLVAKSTDAKSATSKSFTALSFTAFLLFFSLTLVVTGVLLGCLENVLKCRLFYLNFFDSKRNSETGGQMTNDIDGSCRMMDSKHILSFDECVQILNNGGVCCIPTDTVYCLACRADNPEGIRRIYDIKSRPSEKPLSLWLSSIDEIKAVGPEGKGWNKRLFHFMGLIWPGSVSLVVSRGEWLERIGVGSSADLIGTHDSIALRVPNSTLTVSLLRETGPLAITSANPSGACDCTHHNKVDDKIAGKIDFILADGPSPMTIASSVIDVRDLDSNKIFFYRVGCVPEADVWEILRQVDQLEESIVTSTIPDSNLAKVKTLMNLILNSMNCDTWQIYCLQKRDTQQSNNEEGHNKNRSPFSRQSSYNADDDFLPWGTVRLRNPKLTNIFELGLSHYTFSEGSISHKTEMLIPINTVFGVCAVLGLRNKRLDDGTLQPFSQTDVATAKLTSTILLDHIEVSKASDSSRDMMEVAIFGEGASSTPQAAHTRKANFGTSFYSGKDHTNSDGGIEEY